MRRDTTSKSGQPTTDNSDKIWLIPTLILNGERWIDFFLMIFFCALPFSPSASRAARSVITLRHVHSGILPRFCLQICPFLPPSDRHSNLMPGSQFHPPSATINHANRVPDSCLNQMVGCAGTTTQVHVHSLPVHSDTSATSAAETIPQPAVLEHLDRPQTPINVDRLSFLLAAHPNAELVDYVIRGLSEGFSIGFEGVVTRDAPRNLLSAYSHHEQVSAAIALEVSRGHTLGPFLMPPLPDLHCSPIGAVAKDDGSVRLILDLSSPRGSSVNEGISPEEYSVKYCSFDDAVSLVLQFGPQPFMVKADIKHAFRLCPVTPADWHLLGYVWDEQYYFDIRLPLVGGHLHSFSILLLTYSVGSYAT